MVPDWREDDDGGLLPPLLDDEGGVESLDEGGADSAEDEFEGLSSSDDDSLILASSISSASSASSRAFLSSSSASSPALGLEFIHRGWPTVGDRCMSRETEEEKDLLSQPFTSDDARETISKVDRARRGHCCLNDGMAPDRRLLPSQLIAADDCQLRERYSRQSSPRRRVRR